MEITPLKVISSLRDADYYMKIIFVQGGCYKFHLFLKSLFPDSIPLLDEEKGHVVTLINGKMYDITGEVQGVYHALTESDLKMVESWTFAGNKLISLGECPCCEEPIVVTR